MKNKFIKVGGAILVIGITFFVYRYFSDQKVYSRMDLGGSADYPVSKRQYETYMANLDERYKNDNYGSTTPEGTLELFVDALKKEDVDLAAKYFVPEKQKQMEEDLKAGLKSGGVTSLIGDLGKEMIKGNLDESRVRFETVDPDNILEFTFDFRKNKYTDKWKIESL